MRRLFLFLLLLLFVAGNLFFAGCSPDNDENQQKERQKRFKREDQHRVFVEQIGHGSGFHQERALYVFCADHCRLG